MGRIEPGTSLRGGKCNALRHCISLKAVIYWHILELRIDWTLLVMDRKRWRPKFRFRFRLYLPKQKANMHHKDTEFDNKVEDFLAQNP